MNWIKISDQLPEDGHCCWVCSKEKEVYDLTFDKALWKFDFEKKKHVTFPGFRDGEYCCELSLDEITHWMPYFTPSPPQSSEEVS